MGRVGLWNLGGCRTMLDRGRVRVSLSLPSSIHAGSPCGPPRCGWWIRANQGHECRETPGARVKCWPPRSGSEEGFAGRGCSARGARLLR
jgi:hypothetical protein